MKNNGITLIALVITIIILLIMAGVTVNLVIGQNGVLQRTQQASNTMANATANEVTQLDKYASDVDTLTEGYMGNGGNIKIIDGDNVVALETIGSKYGSDVLYNGKTYQLFYVDTIGKYSGGRAGIWLQLKEPIPGYKPSTANNTNTSLISTANSILWQLNPNLDNKYGATLRGLSNWDDNLKAVSGLCNKNYWNTFGLEENNTYIKSTDSGAYIIGGVSVEMFCDSYNEYKQRKNTDDGYFEAQAFNKNSTYGYFYKPKNSSATGNYAEGDYGAWTDNTNWPIATEDAFGMYHYNNITHPWLASPSDYYNVGACRVHGDGNLTYGHTNYSYAVRPAVFLPSNIQIELVK